jgi:hypothetical protein
MATLPKQLTEGALPPEAINLSHRSHSRMMNSWRALRFAASSGMSRPRATTMPPPPASCSWPRIPRRLFPSAESWLMPIGGPSPTAIRATTKTSVGRCRSRLKGASLYAKAKDGRRYMFLRKGLHDDEIIR